MPKCIECKENFATLNECPYCQSLVCTGCFPEHEGDCNLDTYEDDSDLEDDWDEDEDSDLEDEDWEDSDLEDEDEDF